jgi:hypothetical protein
VSEDKGSGGGAAPPTTNPSRRKAPDTIGSLGRAPARTGKLGPHIPAPPPDREPERDRVARIKYHLREAFLGNLGLKFLSLVLALTVFLLVNTDRDHHRNVRAAISYLLPTDRVLVTPQLADVTVYVSGPYRRMRRLELDPIEIDLRDGRDAEIPITVDMVKVPSGVTVTQISPSTLRVAFEKLVTREVAVTPVIAGRPKHGYTVGEVKVDPTTVPAAGGEGEVGKLTDLRTREIRVDGADKSFTAETQIVPPDKITVKLAGPLVVSVEVKEALETRRLGKLAVRVIGDGSIAPIAVMTDPPAIEVVLTGTVLAVDDAVKKGIVPTIKVTAADVAKRRSLPVEVEGVPGVGIELVPAKIEVAPVVQPKP